MQKPKIKSVIQWFLAVVLLVAFAATPVEFAITKTTVARIEHSEWLLEMASVRMDYHPDLIVDHLNRCYVQILHSVLSVFGNSMAVARQFQNILWMFVVLFGYLTIRRLLSGGWIATIALAACVVTAWLRPEDVYQLRAMVLVALAMTVLLWLVVLVLTEVWRQCRRLWTRRSKKEPERMPEAEEKSVQQTEEAVSSAVKQIPNILPEPKKHVKREAIDFTKDVPEEEMHFDVDVASNDDFDLK